MYFLFIVISAVLAWQAFKLMSQGWKVMDEPVRPKISQHPEMNDVKHGDELLVVNFNRPIPARDPLYQSLQNRVESGIIDDPWQDDDDDDDDGNVPALTK
tara:strand:- start:200 stop:499 length:300 start_codon:yes stop_codon:yes gene_type:complete